ncbi:MAG: hypothetical protein HY921_02975 [Elusimicrobia bacterium]|nr:hypothetical protein [Elusimicrobiota bacterium]
MKTTRLAAAALLMGLPLRQALGWGQYGHQEVNACAADLMEDSVDSFQSFMRINKDALKRLAVTPDMDWKMLGSLKKLSPEELEAKRQANRHEHPLHFFEADAFIDPTAGPAAFKDLPSGENYQAAYELYQEKLKAHGDFVRQLDPGKPLEAQAHGTAPWRILQLYDLAVASLRGGDSAKAILYLGALGHYVGDMAQPFHTTLDYNGEHYHRPAAGIHSIFEEKILENAAFALLGGRNKARDGETLLWRLDATHSATLAATKAALGSQGLLSLRRKDVIAEIMALVESGYPEIEPLLASFARECARAQESSNGELYCAAGEKSGGRRSGPKVPAAVAEAFAAALLEGGPGAGRTVMQTAQRRMGQAAVLLARIWVSAYAEAGRPALSAKTVDFKELHVLDNYPVPDYLVPVGKKVTISSGLPRSLSAPRAWRSGDLPRR